MILTESIQNFPTRQEYIIFVHFKSNFFGLKKSTQTAFFIWN